MSEGIRGPGATGAEALCIVPRSRGPEGPLYTVVWAAVCFTGSALHGCAGGSLLHRLSPKERARACVPQRLKPLIFWAVHRSAEALRHPKAAPPKGCATQKLRRPKAAPPKSCAAQKLRRPKAAPPKSCAPKSCAAQKLRRPKAAPPKGCATRRRMVCKTLGGGWPRFASVLWTLTLRLRLRLRSELRQKRGRLRGSENSYTAACGLTLPRACRPLRLDFDGCFLPQRVVPKLLHFNRLVSCARNRTKQNPMPVTWNDWAR